jgi:hypothetical protein
MRNAEFDTAAAAAANQVRPGQQPTPGVFLVFPQRSGYNFSLQRVSLSLIAGGVMKKLLAMGIGAVISYPVTVLFLRMVSKYLDNSSAYFYLLLNVVIGAVVGVLISMLYLNRLSKSREANPPFAIHFTFAGQALVGAFAVGVIEAWYITRLQSMFFFLLALAAGIAAFISYFVNLFLSKIKKS